MNKWMKRSLSLILVAVMLVSALAGKESVMAVHVENMARHPSSFGVAVAFGCWAHRRMNLSFDGSLTPICHTHKGAEL